MLAASPAKKPKIPPPGATCLADAMEAKLALLQPLPIEGPDSALIEVYNRFLAAWRSYFADAATDGDADVTAADKLAWEVVETPACTAAGMLLKIKAVGSQCGTSCAAETVDNWITGDWQIDANADPDGTQIEDVLTMRLRDDLRRMQVTPVSVGFGTVSPELAMMLSMWRERDKVANKAMVDADTKPSTFDTDLRFESERACSAEIALRKAILNTPARSFADMIAKFDVVRPYADCDDWVQMMNEHSNGTDEALWSMCGDLLALGPLPAVALPPAQCRVAEIADEFRKATDRFTAVEEDSRPANDTSKLSDLSALEDRAQFLRLAASHDLAKSVKGALFQIAVVSALMDQAVHSRGWRKAIGGLDVEAPFNLPPEVKDIELQVNRLLGSATTAIARLNGIAPEEYMSDYFLGPDPTKHLGG